MERLITDFTGRVAGLHWSLFGAWLLLLFASIDQAVRLLAEEASGFASRAKRDTLPSSASLACAVLAPAAPAALVCALAAWRRDYGLSLGVAVGTFNCGLGLVLALACLAAQTSESSRSGPSRTCGSPKFGTGSGTAPAAARDLRLRGWVQAAAGLLVCALCFASGRGLPAWSGVLLLGLTAGRLRFQPGLAPRPAPQGEPPGADVPPSSRERGPGSWTRLSLGAASLAASCLLLFPAAQQAAWLAGVRADVIGATLLAWGLCAPRVLACAQALSRGEAGPPLDGVLDANVLGLLLAAGAACVASGRWLVVGDAFLRLHLPIMGGLLLLSQAYFLVWRESLRKHLGMSLLGFYAAYTAVLYWLK